MDKKYICEHCGCDLLGEGVQVDISGRAWFNKETGSFEYEECTHDVEIKCPECYGFTDVPTKIS